jgi:hypothetical protein
MSERIPTQGLQEHIAEVLGLLIVCFCALNPRWFLALCEYPGPPELEARLEQENQHGE